MREWARAQAAKPVECPLMPQDWGFFHDPVLVQRGFTRWEASGFQRMPTLEEVLAVEPTWEDDLYLRRTLQQRMDYFAKASQPKE